MRRIRKGKDQKYSELKSKFPKLTESTSGLSEFWSAFRQIMAMDGRNSLQNSPSPKMVRPRLLLAYFSL